MESLRICDCGNTNIVSIVNDKNKNAFTCFSCGMQTSFTYTKDEAFHLWQNRISINKIDLLKTTDIVEMLKKWNKDLDSLHDYFMLDNKELNSELFILVNKVCDLAQELDLF